jgi:TRAP-type C4-dicarboxylate transport system permease small subunit
MLDGEAVPDGTLITVSVSGTDYATTTADMVYGPASYGILIVQPGGASYAHAAVTFDIGGRRADQSGVWVAGGNTRLDLSSGEATGAEGAGIASVVTQSLPAGSDPTAALVDGVLTLGIPEGQPGAAGPAGADGADGEDGAGAPGGLALAVIALVIAVVAVGIAVRSTGLSARRPTPGRVIHLARRRHFATPTLPALLRAMDAFPMWVERLTMVASVAMLILMVSIMFLATIFRYILESPWKWSEEALVYLMAWSIFILIGSVARQNEHIRIGFVMERIMGGPKRAAVVSNALENIIGVCIAIFLAYAAVRWTNTSREMGTIVWSATGVKYSQWLVRIIPTAGLCLLSLFYLERSIRMLLALVHSRRQPRSDDTDESSLFFV